MITRPETIMWTSQLTLSKSSYCTTAWAAGYLCCDCHSLLRMLQQLEKLQSTPADAWHAAASVFGHSFRTASWSGYVFAIEQPVSFSIQWYSLCCIEIFFLTYTCRFIQCRLFLTQTQDRLLSQDFDICSLGHLTEMPPSLNTLAGGQLLGVVLKVVAELRLLSILGFRV